MVKFGMRVRTLDSLPHAKFYENYLREFAPWGKFIPKITNFDNWRFYTYNVGIWRKGTDLRIPQWRKISSESLKGLHCLGGNAYWFLVCVCCHFSQLPFVYHVDNRACFVYVCRRRKMRMTKKLRRKKKLKKRWWRRYSLIHSVFCISLFDVFSQQHYLHTLASSVGCVAQWSNVSLWPANFPCPALDLNRPL